MVRSHICRRPGPGGTRAGAAVVAIGVGSPVAPCTSRRTWAKRREAQAAVGAVCVLGAGAAVVAEGVGQV